MSRPSGSYLAPLFSKAFLTSVSSFVLSIHDFGKLTSAKNFKSFRRANSLKNICVAASLAVAMVAGFSIDASASTITWETAVQIDDAGAFVNKTGSLLVAINSDDDGDSSINGVNFASADLERWNAGITGGNGVTVSSNAANGNFASTFVQGGGPPPTITDSAINNLISSAIWNPQTVTLTGLTPGETYIVQIISNDSRDNRDENFVAVLSNGVDDVATSLANGTAGLNSLSNSAPTAANPSLPGSAIVGTFIADATIQTFELAGSDNGGASLNSGGRAQINGFQLRTTAEVIPVFNLIHPGITHKRSDLDRMKLMVEAGIEPWASTFEALRNHRRAQFDYEVNVIASNPDFVIEYSRDSDNFFLNDGEAAYYNALMWYITGDERHAEKSIEIFNTYNTLRRNTSGIPLRSGRVWRIIEAAEIIAHTYDGWDPDDIQAFKDMLVFPGYSTTSVPTQAINNGDFTFYWHIYQGDRVRNGNQGLFCMRTMMAMGIFLDNEVMYERALRYLRGQSHRPDDFAYPSGPPRNGRTNRNPCGFFNEFDNQGFDNTIEDYGYNEVVGNYIFENGQSQESSRDQVHALAGVITINNMAEMAWSQGDDLYGELDNRPLLGMEFMNHYNLSIDFQFPDQPTPWEPTIDSGEYIRRTDRSGRFEALVINPEISCEGGLSRGAENYEQPIYELVLGHYRDRLNLPSDDYKWMQRGHDVYTDKFGVETTGVITDHPVWGSLTFRRVSPGDPVSGFNFNGQPQFAMNMLPGTIEAENFDYFPADGQGRTYSDTTAGNQGGAYRFDSDVDIQEINGAGSNGVLANNGEFLTYTVNVPETGNYNIRARVGTPVSNTNIRFSIAGLDQTGEVAVPNTGGFRNFTSLTVAEDVLLTQGVQQVKVEILSGQPFLDSFTFDTFNITEVELNTGELQRSAVESINIVFDGNVELADGAVTLVQRSTLTEETFETVATSVSQEISNNQTVATIEFDSHVRNAGNALDDGNYQLTLTASLITQDGVPMSDDFVFGDTESDQFYSLYGDSNGDRTLNVFDVLAFRRTYRAVIGSSDYDFSMDFDANGTVNVFDLLNFRRRFRATIPFEFGN